MGHELSLLKEFLQSQNLSYDNGITYSVIFTEREDSNGNQKIIATGSVEKNILKCIAVSDEHKGENFLSLIVSDLIQHLADNKIFHYFGFTKPENENVFRAMGLYKIEKTDSVLLLENKKDGFASYLKKILEESESVKNRIENNGNEYIGEVSAIVANCNPFTKGHRYLIETAASKSKILHVFVLSTEQEGISSADRFKMVEDGVCDLENVILHVTEDYLISPLVFPTYFIKEKDAALKINCMLDIEIFCKHIAKTLGITKRYIGTEPYSQVTNTYNEILKKELPRFGIGVEEISRLKIGETVVSASLVRNAIKTKDFVTVKNMLAKNTYEYLEKIGVLDASV